MRPREQPMLDYVLEQLATWKGRWPTVAKGAGVPKRTIEKIANREHANPGVRHIQKLSDWFRAQGSDTSEVPIGAAEKTAASVE